MIKISNLKVGDLFEHKGTMYEIVRKDKWSSYCRYVNDHYKESWVDYLYCNFSNYTKVNV